MYDHKDPTANIAINNVDRARRLDQQHKEWLETHPPKPKERKSYRADTEKVMASSKKIVHINKANYFIMQMNRELRKNEK